MLASSGVSTQRALASTNLENADGARFNVPRPCSVVLRESNCGTTRSLSGQLFAGKTKRHPQVTTQACPNGRTDPAVLTHDGAGETVEMFAPELARGELILGGHTMAAKDGFQASDKLWDAALMNFANSAGDLHGAYLAEMLRATGARLTPMTRRSPS
jgi:hypothetical protein